MNCEYCLEYFNSKQELKDHQNESNTCLKYRNIKFVCIICEYNTIGIKNIEEHMNNCDINYKNLKVNNEINNGDVINYLSRIENKIDFLLENENIKFKIKKQSPTKNIKELKPDILDKKDSPKIKKFKSFKAYITIREEDSIETKYEKIQNIKNLYKISTPEEIESYKKNINECLKTIKQNRTYNKLLNIIKNNKIKIITNTDYKSYYQLLKQNIYNLQNIFKTKDYNEKKIINLISKSLNSIDIRILNYGNYINTEPDIDDMEKFKLCLGFNKLKETDYIPFNYDNFFDNFYNYGSIIFTIKDNLEKYLFNIYNLNNIIYVPFEKSNENDPYSFYILESIDREKRYWRMDCRLEELSTTIINNIKVYLISMFRKLYYDVFHDNIYRKDYKNTIITEIDCEQILENIYFLINQKEFSIFIRKLIIKRSTYIPSENDKCNLYADDILQKKRFLKYKEKSDDIVDLIKQLFDNISSEDAVDFYRK